MKIKTSAKSVLIVEDDTYIGEAIIELLRQENIPSEVAVNGQIALERLSSCSPLPTLILLDLMMPVMDGYSFRRKQLENPSIAHIPVVVMSADGNILNNKCKLSAAAYLRKPMDIETLMTAIRANV